MLTSLSYYVVFLIFGFAAMYLIFSPQVKQYAKTLEFKYSMLTFPYFFGFYTLSSIAAYFLLHNFDFVEPLNWYRVLCPLILAPIIYASAFIMPRIWFILTVTVSIAIIVFLQPIGNGTAFPQIPVLAQRLLFIVLFSIYCLYTLIFNFVPHIYIIFNILILAGLSVFGFIGASPLFISLISGMLIGVLVAYLMLNYYEVKIAVDDGTCVAFSFLISNLLLINLGEFCFSSCLILTTSFWVEMLLAIWYKFFINPQGELFEGTNYYIAAQKYNVNIMTYNLLKIGGIILLLAWFQLFAANSYSLIIVALVFAAWLNTSIGQGLNGLKSLKQINKDFVSDVKKNISEAKEAFTKKEK